MSMATNICTTQANAAAAALCTSTSIDRPPSPITSSQTTVFNTQPTGGVRVPNQNPSRTEELILHELQRLSARMSCVEQELQADTFTSTPRRRKKAKTGGRRGEEGNTGGPVNITDNHSTLDESIASFVHTSRVSIPVHTQHLTRTTSVTTTSLFSQRNPSLLQQGRPPTTCTQTQVVFSSCQTSHPGQHVPVRVMGNRPQDTGSNFSTQMTTNRHGSGVFTGMVSQVNQLPINNIRNSVPNLEQRCNPVMAMGSQMAQPQYPSNQVQQQTCSSNQQNTQIFTGEAQTGGLSQGQGGLGQQLQMAGNELPNNRQGEQQHLIPSLHALKTTAVNQDLVQRRLNELQQQAVPQPTGNANNFI